MPIHDDDTTTATAAFGVETTTMVDRASRPPAAGRVPGVGWILMGASAITLVLTAAARGLISTTPDIYPAAVIDAIESAAAFALAAAIVIGAGHWPPGRAHLLAGAVAFAFAGALQLAYRLWYATVGAEPRVLSDLETVAFWVRAFLEVGAMAAGTGLAAMGLWLSRPGREASARNGNGAIVVIGVAAAVGIVGTVVGGAIAVPLGPDPFLGAVQYVLPALLLLATASLAVAASRYRPIGHHLPELATGVGAFVILLMTGTRQWALVISFGRDVSLQASFFVFEVPMVLNAIGVILVVIGFASGRQSRSSIA